MSFPFPQPNSFPHSLYKYYSFNKYTEGILRDREIFFSSPANFNDPFDCAIIPMFEKGKKSDYFQWYLNDIKSKYPNLSPIKKEKLAKRLLKQNFLRLQDSQETIKRIKLEFDKKLGIFCLTEKFDNLLMWSHYSKDHTGFCIEYDTNILRKVFMNHLIVNEAITLWKINYEEDYPIIIPFGNYDIRESLKSIITKYREWEYEKEWRAIIYPSTNQLVKLPEGAIKKIYIGLNTKETDLQLVKKYITNAKISLFKGNMNRNKFKLDFLKL